jgi:amino acid transporter
LGTTIAAVGCCLATIIGASRILFAMTRGALNNHWLATVSSGSRVPATASVAVGAAAIAAILIVRIAFTSNAFDIFAWSGTTGTLVLLVAYGMFTCGAWYYLCVRGPRQGLAPRRLDYLVPVLALVVVGYTLYRNVLPWPATSSGRIIVILAAVWIVVSIVGILRAPRMTERIAMRFARDEGLTVAIDDESSPHVSGELRSSRVSTAYQEAG